MPISIEKTKIDGLVVIEPHFFEDERGYFIKEYEASCFREHGLPTEFFEFNESKSKKGTLRGLHFQQKFSQGKLIRVIRGSVFDVAVDLRYNSPTFGQWEAFELSESNHRAVYIPKGFAHGFLALEDETIFSYKCTAPYTPNYDSGIRFDDADLNIPWPVEKVGGELIISAKDQLLQSFAEFLARKEEIT